MPIRTGKEYIEGLRDEREVWIDGRRVDDVTTHPAFAEGIRSIARLYDLQHDPAYQDRLTYACPETGESTGMSFLMPKRADDVAKRGSAFTVWAEATGGLMGRSPDFLNSAITAFASAPDFFAQDDPQFGRNIVAYYDHCRRHELCLTHTITDPQVDRSRRPSEQDDPHIVLGLVGESDAGIIVRGAKMLATLGPYSDELVVYPLLPLASEDASYALAFAIPVATRGLKLLCREAMGGGTRPYDHPLAARFDEMDAMAVFDDVVVPWDRVFIKGRPDLANRLRPGTGAPPFLAHQATARAAAKAGLLFGAGSLVAEAIGTDGSPQTQEKLGELLAYLSAVRACVRAAEADAARNEHGVYVPALDPLQASMTLFPRMYPRMVELLQLIGSSGLVMTPSEGDVDGPLGGDVGRYFRGARTSARERIALFRLASDLALQTFGGRQVLYERFYAGDPARLLANNYVRYDRSREVAMVRRLLDGALEPQPQPSAVKGGNS
ncbi:MAG: 4-hydroxyphenylacetate 3-monooxygenase, oxygenase component [Actinomycetota bacterium]